MAAELLKMTHRVSAKVLEGEDSDDLMDIDGIKGRRRPIFRLMRGSIVNSSLFNLVARGWWCTQTTGSVPL